MRIEHPLLFAASLSLLGGCAGGGGATAPRPPEAAETPQEGGQEQQATEEAAPPADVLYVAHEAVPERPASCKAGTSLATVTKCSEAHDDLASALGLSGAERDTALLGLEGCEEFPRGLIRALRAELGPAECADALVEPLVGDGKTADGLPLDVKETLVALGLGAQLRRLAVDPPKAPAVLEKEVLDAYFKDELFPWTTRQAQAIFIIAAQGTHLSGYARGVVAIEAGNADMRFVELVRAAPVTKTIAEDERARDEYYGNLDQLLEPRKARGRNAALVGLREMARVGVRTSERLASARSLLSKVYGGRRVNALDTLLVPPVAEMKAEGAAAAIASRVPTAYAAGLTGKSTNSALFVRAHLQMGMPPGLKTQVQSEGDADSRLLLARALFESGRTYFRAEDFQDAIALLTPLLDAPAEAEKKLSSDSINVARLLNALSVALVAGPKDAADMIAQGPRFADALGNLVFLDGLAAEKSELGGRASFNAAYLRELVAPEGAPEYWGDLAQRYQAASAQLRGPERKTARDRADACREIEKTLRKQK